jgi:hypothetical protein
VQTENVNSDTINLDFTIYGQSFSFTKEYKFLPIYHVMVERIKLSNI